MADSQLTAAIDELEAQLREELATANETKRLINSLCKRAKMSPRYELEDMGASVGPIRSDQYYGQPLSTVVRDILVRRKASGLGAATVNELYDMMKKGGYQFEVKDDTVGRNSLRNSLTKNSNTFHKLPNGQFGLLDWYPNAKEPKKIVILNAGVVGAGGGGATASTDAAFLDDEPGPEPVVDDSPNT